MIGNAPIVLFATNREGVITLSEGRGLATLDRVPGQSVGQSIFTLYAYVPKALECVRRALRGEEVPG